MQIRRVAVTAAWVMAWSLVAAAPAVAAIDLEWRPLTQTVNVGDPVGIGLFAVSDSGAPQGFSSVQVIMDWDPTYLALTGNDTAGALPLLGSSFLPGDSFGINEADPPADGDAMWVGTVFFGQELDATPTGSLLTTITFTALAPTPSTLVGILPEATHPPRPTGRTKLLDLEGDALGVFGGPAEVIIIPEPGVMSLLTLVLALSRRR